MNVSFSTTYQTGATVFIRVFKSSDLSVLLARTSTGVIEFPAGSGIFTWQGSLTDTTDYVVVWDSGGNYAVESFGQWPTLQAQPGLVGTLGIELVNPVTDAVLAARSTASITELVAASGIYLWNGAIPGLAPPRILYVWDTGGGTPKYASEEIAPNSSVSIPVALAVAGVPTVVVGLVFAVVAPPASATASVPPVMLVQLVTTPPPQFQIVSFKEVGADAPQEIKRARRQVMDMLRKSGQPVVLKHRYSVKDVENGIAKVCPACWDDDLKQTRGDCPICFRVGFVSIQDGSAWINVRGRVASSDPGTHVRTPLHGGYSQGYLTWMIEPDSSVDVFKPDESGVMVQTQQAQGYAPWFPTLFDNDLAINVSLDRNGQTVLGTNERWELKLVNPNTIRGWGSLPSGVVHNVWQTFEMARTPDNTIFYAVPL